MKYSTRHSPLWFLAAAAVSILSIGVNLGGAWWGDPARWEHAVVTVLYLLFWLIFTVTARSCPPMLKCCVAMATLTAVTCVVRLMEYAGGVDVLMLPALLLTLLFSVPLYGLRFLPLSWTAMDTAVLVLSSLWLLYARKLLKKI